MPEIVSTLDGSLTIRDERTGATFHSVNGAVQESTHVFIQTGLLLKLQQLTDLNILEVGFGTGLNAFLTFKQMEKHKRLFYAAIDLYPLATEIFAQLNYSSNEEEKKLFDNITTSPFNKDIVIDSNHLLHKYEIDFTAFNSDRKFDLIYFDAFSPAEQPELWTAPVMEKCASLLKSNGILVTYCAQGQFKRNLKAAGFEVEGLPGPPGKRQITRAIRK